MHSQGSVASAFVKLSYGPPKHANRGWMGPSSFVRRRRNETQKSEVRAIHGILLDFNGIFRREDRVFGTILPWDVSRSVSWLSETSLILKFHSDGDSWRTVEKANVDARGVNNAARQQDRNLYLFVPNSAACKKQDFARHAEIEKRLSIYSPSSIEK